MGVGRQGVVRECRSLCNEKIYAVKIMNFSAEAEHEIKNLKKCQDNRDIVQIIEVIRDEVRIFDYFLLYVNC